MPKTNRKAPEKTHWQTICFEQKIWTKEEAIDWLKEHDHYYGAYHGTKKYHRFRQYDTEQERFEYRWQTLKVKGVAVVLGIPQKNAK